MLDVTSETHVFVNQTGSILPVASDSRLSGNPGAAPREEERRSKIRYAIDLEVRFSKAKRTSRSYNVGHTLNISSSGLLIASPCVVTEGTALQLMIEWPYSLDGKIPLQLVATGFVVRSSASQFAVSFRSYQFRTMRPKSTPEKAMVAQVSA